MQLTIEALDNHDGSAQSLRGSSFEIGDGQCLARLGRNGAGKAIMRRCLTGVLKPSAGRITLDGTDIAARVRAVDAAMPSLETSTAAAIVVISSVSGREVDFAAGPYGVFKAALIHNAKGLFYLLAGNGIRVTARRPGAYAANAGAWRQFNACS